MTQDESFPGRPRGRRARHSNDESDWQGNDAAAHDQREFPDLDPIRPRGAREQDLRRQGQQGQAARPAQPGGYGGYQGAPGAGYAGGGRAQGGGYGGGQYAGGGYPGGAPQGGGYGGQGQAEQGWGGQPPWPEQQAPQQQAPQQAPQPQAPQRRAQQAVAQQPKKVDETPSWAEPDAIEEFSERWHRRGHEARREEQQAGQRKRRRLLVAGGAVVALAIAATVYLVSGGPGAASLGFGDDLVINFLPGELQSVPNPCTTVSPATLNQYLPGKTKQVSPPQNSGAFTECTWTLDSQPTFRVIDVQAQAYSPSGLASGNGSATFAALDAFQAHETGLAKPDPKTGQSAAKVTDLTGMPGGTATSAFQATRVTDRGGATVDEVYVYVRYRNVIVQVKVDGLNQDSGGKHYTVSMSDLTPAATAVAKEMAEQIVKQS